MTSSLWGHTSEMNNPEEAYVFMLIPAMINVMIANAMMTGMKVLSFFDGFM